jgi:hypothetical protein
VRGLFYSIPILYLQGANIIGGFNKKIVKIFVTLGVTNYLYIMIESIIHKGLRLLWEKDDPSKLPPEQVGKIRRILETLDIANNLDPLRTKMCLMLITSTIIKI